jgi:hypothetical protein
MSLIAEILVFCSKTASERGQNERRVFNLSAVHLMAKETHRMGNEGNAG